MKNKKFLKIIDSSKGEDKKNDTELNFFHKFLMWVLPQANPDFKDLFDKVDVWLIEFDIKNSYVNREVGIDKNNTPITIAPFQENLGFWIDSDSTYEFFIEHSHAEIISKEEFDSAWNIALNKNLKMI